MKLLFTSLILFLVLSSTVLAQSFKERVIFTPEIAFLWSFQRGIEELYRFTKFTSAMRVDYSLELSERRIGEMEILIDKNNSKYVPTPENEYEIELEKIKSDLNSTDIFSKFLTSVDIKQNVTERLQYNNQVLNNILKNAFEPAKTSLTNAVKKTSECISFINRLQR